MSVGLQGFCESPLGWVGMALLPTPDLWSRSTHTSYSGVKAESPAVTMGTCSHGNSRDLRCWEDTCETSCDKKRNSVTSMDVPSGEANPVAKSNVKGQGNACRLWKGQECVDAQTAEELGTHYSLLEPLQHSSDLTGLWFSDCAW